MAWQVLSDLVPVDPDLAKRVDDLVKQLDAELLTQRESASAELRKLGRPGALALLKVSRQGLSQEQNTCASTP